MAYFLVIRVKLKAQTKEVVWKKSHLRQAPLPTQTLQLESNRYLQTWFLKKIRDSGTQIDKFICRNNK